MVREASPQLYLDNLTRSSSVPKHPFCSSVVWASSSQVHLRKLMRWSHACLHWTMTSQSNVQFSMQSVYQSIPRALRHALSILDWNLLSTWHDLMWMARYGHWLDTYLPFFGDISKAFMQMAVSEKNIHFLLFQWYGRIELGHGSQFSSSSNNCPGNWFVLPLSYMVWIVSFLKNRSDVTHLTGLCSFKCLLTHMWMTLLQVPLQLKRLNTGFPLWSRPWKWAWWEVKLKSLPPTIADDCSGEASPRQFLVLGIKVSPTTLEGKLMWQKLKEEHKIVDWVYGLPAEEKKIWKDCVKRSSSLWKMGPFPHLCVKLS